MQQQHQQQQQMQQMLHSQVCLITDRPGRMPDTLPRALSISFLLTFFLLLLVQYFVSRVYFVPQLAPQSHQAAYIPQNGDLPPFLSPQSGEQPPLMSSQHADQPPYMPSQSSDHQAYLPSQHMARSVFTS